MNLFDFLRGNTPDYTNNMPALKPAVDIAPVQLGQDGEMVTPTYTQPMQAVPLGDKIKNTANAFGQRLSNALLGTASDPTDNINTADGTLNVTVSSNPRTGGILRDIAGGYNENRFTPASLNNFGQNTLDDGRRKGFAYRLGEGIGSLARFGESPLGRSLLVGGAISAIGGSPAEALTYGAVTGAGNQMNRTIDRIYRNDLIQSQQNALRNNPNFAKLGETEDGRAEQQRQLQAVADNINDLRGYVNQNTYGNLIKSQQLRDNADWKRMYFDAQQKNLKEQQEWRKQQAEMQRSENAANRAVQIRGQNLNYELGKDRIEASKDKNNNNTENFADIEQQLNNFQATFKDMPSKVESYTLGALRGATGTQTEKEANFNAQRTLLFNQIARKLGGEKGVLSDNDIKRIEAALPTLTDSLQQKNAKMQAVYDLLDIKRGQSPRSQTYTSGKYTVRIK